MPAPARAARRTITTAGVVIAVVAGVVPALLFTSDAGAAVRPSKLVFTTQPGAGTPGTRLATQPVVTTTDADGRKVSSGAAVRVTLTGPAGVPLERLAAVTCTSAVVSASAGVATFAGCKVNRGGVYSLTAVDAVDNLTVVSNDFFVSGPADLKLGGTPGGTAGSTWASQPEVTVVDGHGDTVTASTAEIALGISPGTGTAGAVLSCTAKKVTATSGVAHFAGCGIDRSGSGYRLVAIDGTDVMISSPGTAFSVAAGTPSQLAFRTLPAGAVGGAGFVTQPVVVVQDAQGNTAIGNTDTVGVAIKAGTGSAGATVSCAAVPAVDGVVTFDGCAIDKAGSGYVLVATDSTAGVSVESAPFDVAAGTATHLSFATQPGGGPGGAAFATQPVVRITDDGGNLVPGTVTLAIVADTGAAGATLGCAANPAAAADGVATFAGCAITSTGSGYRLRATAGSLTVDSDTFDISAGSPTAATFATQPGAGTGGSAFSTQPVVTLADSGGNAAAGPVTLAIAPGTGTPGATLTCATDPLSTTAGTATFSGCAIDRTGEGYRLVATSGSARRFSEPFDVTVGPAARLAFTRAPGGGTGGTAWSAQPSVAVQDAGGNLVATATPTLGLSVAAGTGAGSLTCTANSLPAIRGVVNFSGCAIDRTASAYRLVGSDGNGLSVTSAPFAVGAGAPTALVFSAQPGGANAGVALAAQPAVTAVDAGGNPATGATPVALSVTRGTGGGAGVSCAAKTLTAAPTASFRGCAIPTAGSGYTLTATAGNLRAESSPFAVLLPAPAPLGAAPTDVPLAQTFGGRDLGSNPTNVIDGVNTATGSSTFARDDLTVAAIGVPFDLARTYNSTDTTGGAFGPGWSSLFDMNVTIAADGTTATVRGADGQQLVFRSRGLGGLLGWDAPAGARASLSCTVLGCTVQRFDGYSFTVSGGHVASFQSPASPGLTFTWSATKVVVRLASSASKALNVVATLDSTGRVTKVSSPTRAVSYGYTGGLLTNVTDVLGKAWAYGYTANRLTGITDPTGVVRQTTSYDAQGRVTATTRQGSAKLVDDTFAWSTGRATRSALANVQGVTQRVDSTDEYVGRVLVKQTTPIGAVTRYSYDARLNLIAVQDPMGWVRQLSYDAADNLTRVADPITSTSSAVVTMTYDSAHKLLTQTDANGNTSTLTYNSTAPVVASSRPAGVNPGTEYSYNLLTELTRQKNSTGQEIYTYDAYGNRTGTQQQDLRGASLNGRGTLVTYDEAGNKLTSVDPRGNLAGGVDTAYASTWTYDAAGHQLTQKLPGPVTTTNVYDAAGELASVTNAAGTTTYAWDQSTRTMTITAPSGTTKQAYDPSGNLLTQTQSTSRQTTTHTYDAAGREISSTDAAGVRVDYTFDIEGNVVRATNSQGALVIRQFDSLNRPVRDVIDGVESRTTYDPVGNVTSTTDAGGAVTRTTYNAHNKIATVTTAAGTTTYAYDNASDLLLSTTDAAGHVTSYTYDAAQRRTSLAKGGNTTRFGYDLTGNLASTTDPDGRTTTVTSNALNLPTKKVYAQSGQPTLTVTTAYDATGRRTAMTDDSGTHGYTYDAAGNLTATSGPSGNFSYDYSKPGTITETYPDGTKIAYGLDDSSRLMSLTAGTPGSAGYVSASYVRDATGQTTALAFNNGVLETRGYDRSGNVLDQQLRNAKGALADTTFSYDAAGNRLTQRTTSGGTTTANAYGYDATGRVTSFTTASGAGTLTGATIPDTTSPTDAPAADVTVPGGPDVTPAFGVTTAVDPAVGGAQTAYGYDGVGNRRTVKTAAGTVTTTHDAADQITQQTGAGAVAWAYDRSGNVTRAGAKTFTYDAAGRLASVVVDGGATVSYRYDGDGNRISKTVGSDVTKYVWDLAGDLPQLVLEQTGSGDLVRRYLYGDGPVAMQTPTATYWYHLDPIGNVAELTDASGALAAQYHYDAFGNVTTTGPTPPANPTLFQGQFLDSDTGLYNMRARQYDATTGRFTQRDPQEQAVGAPSESAYVFAANRPTVFTDPTGRTPTVASTFMGHANTETNVAANTKLGLAALGLGLKAVSKIGGYSAAVTTAATKTAVSAEVAAAANVGKTLSKVGTGLAVAGIALQVFITVEDCLTKDAYTCAGSVVGTAISIGFTVGCAVLTVGAGAVACAIVGAVLGIGLQYVITEFGPDIVAGLIAGAGLAVQGAIAAVAIIGPAVLDAVDAVSTFAVEAGGAIVAGIHTATAAIASGFDTAITTLVNAGYAAAALADVLANAFDQGIDQAVGALVGLGYQIADIATSVIDVFAATAVQFAGVLKDGLDYTATQISGALQSAYGTVAAGAAEILEGAGFAVDQVAGALKATYALAADVTATVLDGVGYAYGQVAGALQSVFDQTDQAVATLLAGLDATAAEVGAALRDFYADVDTATAAALQFAAYTAGQIAGALSSAYDTAAQGVATILDGLQFGATQIAGALKDVFATIDVQAAQFLRTLGHGVQEVAAALQSAYSEAAQAVSSALRTVGYTVLEVGSALKDTFSQAAAGAAALLQQIGYDVASVGLALKETFAQAAADAAATLEGVGYQIGDVATVLANQFALGASAAADVLVDLFTTTSVALVLVSVFAQSTQQVASVFKGLGYGASALAGILKNAFSQAGAQVAQILKNIGVAAADIAAVLQNVFGQAVADVANLLKAIGFSNDTINAIGNAFKDFGKKVANCFTSFFSDC